MKICVDLRPLHGNDAKRGIGIYIINLIKHILEIDKTNEYILVIEKPLENYPFSRNYSNVRLHELHIDYSRSKEEIDSSFQLFIRSNAIDLFFITSPFDRDIYLPVSYPFCKTLAIVYDLIPLIFPEWYLTDIKYREEYYDRLKIICNVDKIFTISISTKNDVIKLLNLEEKKIEVVYAGIDTKFNVIKNLDLLSKIKHKFSIVDKYIMCTSGYDPRKNINILFKSFSLLPDDFKREYQLVLVCRLSKIEEKKLREIAQSFNIPENKLIFTNFVSEDDLMNLYNGSSIFVFPSLYEGFGLPVVEAMASGTPVVTSNTSSLYEIAKDAAFTVDPRNPELIADAISLVLSDNNLRQKFITEGINLSKKFNWNSVARKVFAVIDSIDLEKLKIAYFSPLRPIESGISDYSEDLLPYLTKYAKIHVYTECNPINEEILKKFKILNYDDFIKLSSSNKYDFLIYNMGNNEFHEKIYKILQKYPGIVVMHDYSLHAFIYHISWISNNYSFYMNEMIYCNGDAGKVEAQRVIKNEKAPDIFNLDFNLNKRVIDSSTGVIVHNQWMKDRIAASNNRIKIKKINMGVEPINNFVQVIDEKVIFDEKDKLKIRKSSFIISSLGIVQTMKRIDKVLRAFARFLVEFPDSVYILAGKFDPTYKKQLLKLIEDLKIKEKIIMIDKFIGFNWFQNLIELSDVCINLRYPTLGETSGALIRILMQGKPVIVTNINQFKEIPDNCCWKVDLDDTEEILLAEYLKFLASNEKVKKVMGRNARVYALENHCLETTAKEYIQFMNELKGCELN